MNSVHHDTNSPRDHPERVDIIRSNYYSVQPISEDAADVYLFPEGRVYHIEDGKREYDVTALVVRGVHFWPGMEEDIRARYHDWCESAEVIAP